MFAFYAQIKLIHVVAVLASGGLFFVRGTAVQLGQAWAMRAPLRRLSYAIDTTLLAAALLLVAILPGAMFANGWLTVKLVLLVFYIGFGTFALKRARTAAMRRACFAVAVLLYLAVVVTARSHDPLGALRWLIA